MRGVFRYRFHSYLRPTTIVLGATIAPLNSDVNTWHTDVPPTNRRTRHPVWMPNFSFTASPASDDVVQPQILSTTMFTTVPTRRRPPLPKGCMGWLNRDNELAGSLRHTSLPQRGRNRHSYQGWQTHTLYEFSFNQGNNKHYDVPLTKDKNLYTGFIQANTPEDVVEAAQRIFVEVPKGRNRNASRYEGFTAVPLSDDINEYMVKILDVPPKGKDRKRWIADGVQAFDVVGRDENGDLVEIKFGHTHDALPTKVRNRISYEGWLRTPQLDAVEDAVAGYLYDALPPTDAIPINYEGWQYRCDYDNLVQVPIAGFRFTDLPPKSKTSLKILNHIGTQTPPLSEDFVPTPETVWRPLWRPRRRRS